MPWQNNGDGDRPNPWGNGPRRGGGGEPPNIDEFIRKGQDQLRKALPGGKGGPIIILLVVVLIWLFSGFYRVEPNEQAVVLRFGKWIESTSPGLHWHLPFPIESREIVGVKDEKSISIGTPSAAGSRNSKYGSRDNLMLTGDENIVDIRFTVVWRINAEADAGAAGKYLFNVRDPEHTVRMVSEGVMREVVGKKEIQHIIKNGKEEVEEESKERIQSILNGYDSGIKVLRVQIGVADPPSEVIEYFQDVQKADLDQKTLQNEAEAYARKIVPVAEGKAVEFVQLAEAYRARTVSGAQGEATRFMSVYNEYKLAKDVTKKRMYLETMEEILSGMDKIILDGEAGKGAVPYLSLDQLNKSKTEGGK